MHLSIEGLCGGIDSKISPRGGAFVKMASKKCAWESTRERSASLPHQMDTNPHLRGLHQKKMPQGWGIYQPHMSNPHPNPGGGGGGGGGDLY